MYNLSVAMERMEAEKNHCLTEMELKSEQLTYTCLLYHYLRSTTMFRSVGLVSLGFSFRYGYYHLKVSIDHSIFDQMILNYITLMFLGLQRNR